MKSLLKALDRQAPKTKERCSVPITSATTEAACGIRSFTNKVYALPTGVVEAGCKVVTGTRLKRAGMHWTVGGANATIALRCSKLSGRYEDFWERRSERAAARSHPSNPTCTLYCDSPGVTWPRRKRLPHRSAREASDFRPWL
jgi:hypothetical protein